MLHVGGVTDVGVQLDLLTIAGHGGLATVGLQLLLTANHSLTLLGHGLQSLVVGLDVVVALDAVHHHHLTAQGVIHGDVSLHQGGDTHDAGQNGGVAVGGTVLSDKSQDLVLRQLNGLRGSQVLGNQNAGPIHLKTGAAAAQDVDHTGGHVAHVRSTGLHVGVVHGSKVHGKLFTSLLDSLCGAQAVLDLGLDALQIVQIVQHHHLDIQNHSLLLAQLLGGLIHQVLQLRKSNLLGFVKLLLLHGGVAAGDGQGGLPLAIEINWADGHAGANRQSRTSYHNVPPKFI